MNALRFLLILVAAAMLAGCVVTKTVETVILDTKLDGPTTPIPVHITTPRTPNSITITPSFSFGSGRPIAGEVEGSSGTQYPGPAASSPYNLSWNLPASSAAIEVDIAREATAFTFGANMASTNGFTQWGLLASVGTFAAKEGNMAMRVDIGLSFQGVSQRTSSMVVTTTEDDFLWSHTTTVDTAYCFDSFTQNRFGYFASLTFNTYDIGIPFNFAVQAAFHRQTLISFEPRTQVQWQWLAPSPIIVQTRSSGGEATTAASFISLAPSISVDLMENTRLVAGARILWPVSDNVQVPKSVVMPFVRFDYSFH